MKQNYIDLKMPSIMGMGAVGPTLSVLTASLFSALVTAVESPPHWAYPVIMLVLAGLLAVFPVSKEKIPKWQRFVLWPIVAVIIFAAAWGTNHGLSLGEEALNGQASNWRMPSLVSSAYAQDTNEATPSKVEFKVTTAQVVLQVLSHAKTNEVDFLTVNFKDKMKVRQNLLKDLPPHVWGLDCSKKSLVLLKAKDGKWWAYRKIDNSKRPTVIPKTKSVKTEPLSRQQIQGGFFKRWR